jgi:hypothetical protein
VINGSRDNQLMSGAITPVNPPACPGPIANQTKCENATSFTYEIPAAQIETGVTYRWTLTNGTPSAGAKISGADPNTGIFDGTTVTVVPVGTAFTVGTFSLNLTMIKAGTANVPCPAITGTVNATPAKPTICEVPLSLCPSGGATTMTLKVGNLLANAYYVVTQGSTSTEQQAPATVTAATVLTFTGLTPGGGISVHGETRSGTTVLCTGPAAGCADLTTCAAPSSTTRSVAPTEEVQKVQTIDARILGKSKVLAAPNPFTDKVRFTLLSDVSGQGSLEIYNTVGQKIHTVYQGHVEAGRQLVKEYNVPIKNRTNLIYVFKVGDQKTTGKLINW